MAYRPTDAELIAASLAEPARFADLFDRHFDAIHRYVRRRIGGELAEDLAAETFVEALRVRPWFDQAQSDARPWLYGIAANLLRHHRREERRRLMAYARTGVDPVAADEFEPPTPGSMRTCSGPRLALALASLRAGDRALSLRHQDRTGRQGATSPGLVHSGRPRAGGWTVG